MIALADKTERSLSSLCIVTHGYPCHARPTWFPFTREFAHAAARRGVAVSVIAPVPLHLAGSVRPAAHELETVAGGGAVEVFRPRYLSASSVQIARWNTALIGWASFTSAARKILASRRIPRPDVLYGHFLYLGGATAVRLGEELGIPAFPMVGDGRLNSMEPFGVARACRHFAGAAGFMANSSGLAVQIRRDLGIPAERIGVFPNGVDHRVFYPRDRTQMRLKWKLPLNRLLVVCAAKQDLQKGPVRVGAAIADLTGVAGVFLGAGPVPPRASNVVFNQPVPHAQVPELLSAADLFVLPSTFEGCCNALLEAMACGLPVVASAGDFNDDILNADVSLRIDPLDVGAIRTAIAELRDDPVRRKRMGEAAQAWSRNFDVEQRAQRMLVFMAARRNPPSKPETAGCAS